MLVLSDEWLTSKYAKREVISLISSLVGLQDLSITVLDFNCTLSLTPSLITLSLHSSLEILSGDSCEDLPIMRVDHLSYRA
jgi:hypothetical protein